jgi:hypothetical protein
VAPSGAMASGGAFFGGNIDPTTAPIATPQGTAADGTKIYEISKSSGLIAHQCRAIGTYKGVGAVFCADLYAQPDATAGKIDVYAIVEAYCEVATDPSAYPQCAGANSEFLLIRSDGWKSSESDISCGSGFPTACSSNYRNFFEFEQVIAAGACPELWTDAYGMAGGNGTSSIELPGDVFEFTESDLTTARAEIC